MVGGWWLVVGGVVSGVCRRAAADRKAAGWRRHRHTQFTRRTIPHHAEPFQWTDIRSGTTCGRGRVAERGQRSARTRAGGREGGVRGDGVREGGVRKGGVRKVASGLLVPCSLAVSQAKGRAELRNGPKKIKMSESLESPGHVQRATIILDPEH